VFVADFILLFSSLSPSCLPRKLRSPLIPLFVSLVSDQVPILDQLGMQPTALFEP
jgi:hypothetical protein